ncbi:hypothetical protein AURDEDRAFT_163465 [Auricularia subglabra TFB-10046 SS5]|nr:hypothetical protein AURDEDRAFT_163465 [Auricularia subglabra TFB-10046 SS5]
MSRGGQQPVDFECSQYSSHLSRGTREAVGSYMHRFRSFKWPNFPDKLYLSRPAHFLREFVCKYRFEIPSDFLGGCAANLRILSVGDAVFPKACPALSTVTHLRATYPEYGRPSFRHLFDLFPRLETLHLRDLDKHVQLPSGTAPRTLKDVTLESSCNLIPLYNAWDLIYVPQVQLHTPIKRSASPASLLQRASELSMTFAENLNTVRIAAQLPYARCRTIVGIYIPEAPLLAEILLDGAVLSETHTLEIPLSVLGPVTAASPRWPRLKHLTVHVIAFDGFETHEYELLGPHPRFRWNLLGRVRGAPALASLAIYVRSDDVADPPTLSEAQGLKRYLSTLAGYTPREVHVHGFPGDVVSAMMPPWETDVPKLVFEN